MQKKTNAELREIATQGRMMALKMVYKAASGHIGGSLSCMDILTELYFNIMNIDPTVPSMEERDRLVMSKGHCSPGLYSILALRGFFPKENLSEMCDADGKRTKALMSGLAREYKTNIVAGSVGTLREGKCYNTAYVFDREGNCVYAYDKMHCFSPSGEHEAFEYGREYGTFQVDGVVEIDLQACTPYCVESFWTRQAAEAAGVPYLALETDYSQADGGQLSTRLEAFLEILE